MSPPTYTKPVDATHEVIEIECAALVRWGMGDPSGLPTFNYASYGAQDEPSRWNCTEVYRRTQDKWGIIQSHWSYTVAKRA